MPDKPLEQSTSIPSDWGEHYSDLKKRVPTEIKYTTSKGEEFTLVRFNKDHALAFAKAALEDPEAGQYFDFADAIQRRFNGKVAELTAETAWDTLVQATMGEGGMHGLGLDYAVLDAKGNFTGIRGYCPSSGTTESLPADPENGVPYDRPATVHNLDMHAYTLPEHRDRGIAAHSAAALALATYPLLDEKGRDALLTMTISEVNDKSLSTARKLGMAPDKRFNADSSAGVPEVGFSLPFSELAQSAAIQGLARLIKVEK